MLWFDVESLAETTVDIIVFDDDQLWFDVESLAETTRLTNIFYSF